MRQDEWCRATDVCVDKDTEWSKNRGQIRKYCVIKQRSTDFILRVPIAIDRLMY